MLYNLNIHPLCLSDRYIYIYIIIWYIYIYIIYICIYTIYCLYHVPLISYIHEIPWNPMKFPSNLHFPMGFPMLSPFFYRFSMKFRENLRFPTGFWASPTAVPAVSLAMATSSSCNTKQDVNYRYLWIRMYIYNI